MKLTADPRRRPPRRPAAAAFAACRGSRRAITLVELLVVLVILVALAGLVVTNMSREARIMGTDGVQRDASEIVTRATMQTVRDALVGASASEPGYLQDVGELPSRLGALLVNLDNEPLYDPATKRGWRGPYLADGGSRYGDRIESGDGFPNNWNISGIENDPAILDAWGKPVVLQIPKLNSIPQPRYARLVSAGPSRRLDTDRDDLGAASRGDDLVLFLRIADPNPTEPE